MTRNGEYMRVVKQTSPTAAAVVPTATARAALRPLGLADVRLTGGLLHQRQRLNRDVTLHHGAGQLEKAGTLDNFRIAAGLTHGERHGMVFSDSDVYKWLEALAWEIGREPSEQLQRLADDAVALVVAAQLPDGYLNTFCQINDPAWRWTDLEMGHELYCAGHLIQAGVAFARATGDETLLGVARRFADLIDDEFRVGAQTGADGHPEIEMALVELFRVTGESRYLELAKTLTERRGRWRFEPSREYAREYFIEAQPVRETRAIGGHAVRALYLLSAVTDLYTETDDAELLQSAVAQWDDLTAGKMYLTGGVGSRHFGEAIGDTHELPPDRAYCETCASTANIMWNWRMLLATGDARYADLVERTLYNGFLAGTALSGDEFFYVNPLQSRGGHTARTSWDRVACCPPNIMRLVASVQQYLATADDTGLQIHQYAGADIDTSNARVGRIGVRLHTAFPWDGRIEVEVTGAGDDEWCLSLRIPSWASGATVDGVAVDAGAYARLSRRWKVGDRVVVELNIAPRLTTPHPRLDAVRGCVALERGPLVYCVEQADLPPGVELADVLLDAKAALRDADTPADHLDGIPAAAFAARISNSDRADRREYRAAHQERSSGGECRQLLAVPYFAWGNRGIGSMRVWIPEAPDPSSQT
jgi:hypothetical protein